MVKQVFYGKRHALVDFLFLGKISMKTMEHVTECDIMSMDDFFDSRIFVG